MSKSRGTGLDPLKCLGMNRMAALLPGRQAQCQNEDIDFNADDFLARVNSDDLVNRYINIASRAAGFIAKRCRKLGEVIADGAALLDGAPDGRHRGHYETREYAKALRETMALTDRVSMYVDQNKPWELAKQRMDARLQDVCTVCIEAFRLLTVDLKPVLALAGRSRPS
jgi:methionyl-tRNA synthetase